MLRAAIPFADKKWHPISKYAQARPATWRRSDVALQHVANKDDMLDGMIDVVFTEIDLRSSGIHWKKAMRQRAFSARDTLSRHPWAIGLTDRG